MITAIASGLHGYNAASKGIIMAAHCTLYGTIAYFCADVFAALIVMLLCVVWWFVFRGSKQARIELDKMDTINPPHPTYTDVMKAHYFTGFLAVLALYFYNYETKPKLINNGKFWDCRRPTEIATGLTGDVMIMVLMCLMTF